jgi:hypothetical protein
MCLKLDINLVLKYLAAVTWLMDLGPQNLFSSREAHTATVGGGNNHF